MKVTIGIIVFLVKFIGIDVDRIPICEDGCSKKKS